MSLTALQSPNDRRGSDVRNNNQRSKRLEGEVRTIAGQKNVRIKDITIAANDIPVNVQISEFNPRILTSVSSRHISRLAKDIKENGQLMPIWVYQRADKLYVLDGACRKRAVQENKSDLKAKLITGDLDDNTLRRIANSLAMSEGMSFIEMGRVWAKQFDDLNAGDKKVSLRKFCSDNKLAMSMVSDAIRAHKLPESLKSVFPRITTLGRGAFTKLGAINTLMTKATDAGRYDLVSRFENEILIEIDVDEIEYNHINDVKRKIHESYLKQKVAAQLEENAKAVEEERDAIIVDIEKPEAEVSDAEINRIIFQKIDEILNESGLVPTKVTKSKKEKLETLTKEPTALTHSVTGGIRIDLLNVSKKKQEFAVEVNKALVSSKTSGTVSSKRIDEAKELLTSMDSNKAKMLLGLIEQLAEQEASSDIPDNVTHISKAS
jgi:DNA-binding TFAR19-related protein (PDSD5 family)